MAVQLGGVTYELEGLLFRRMPSCNLRKAGGIAEPGRLRSSGLAARRRASVRAGTARKSAMRWTNLSGDDACGPKSAALHLPSRLGAMDFDEAEQVLRESSGHRVLRRVPSVSEWPLSTSAGQTRTALFVDVKTTGPNIDTDQVMAIGIIAFDYDLKSGALISVGEAMAFDDPVPTEIEEIEGLAREAQLVIAHDAAFVRPMAEKLSTVFAEMNWAGSWSEINWAHEGLVQAKVDDLLLRLGWFNDGMDVASQARAGAFLMSLTLPCSGLPALQVLLTRARRKISLIRADEGFEKREALKEHGYHWDNRHRYWWILTEAPQVEIAWLNAVIYDVPRAITPIEMPATRRYSRRVDE